MLSRRIFWEKHRYRNFRVLQSYHTANFWFKKAKQYTEGPHSQMQSKLW